MHPVIRLIMICIVAYIAYHTYPPLIYVGYAVAALTFLTLGVTFVLTFIKELFTSR